MTNETDITAQEIETAQLLLRSDLLFTPQSARAPLVYQIEDPFTGKFYRVGHAEYVFLSLLDGRRTTREALHQLATAVPEHGLSDGDVVSICKWLCDTGLARVVNRTTCSHVWGEYRSTLRRERLGKLNPLVLRLALVNPARFLAALYPWIGWLLGKSLFPIWLAVIISGYYQVAVQWGHFSSSLQRVFSPDQWIWLAGCWIALKFLHEGAHGLVCMRYGTPPREAGLTFVAIAPLAYIDVTPSWQLRNRWQRMHVASAGMYAELAVAGVAAWVWALTSEAAVAYVAGRLVLLASITTLLFNANPLMRFDGYYILSDLLRIPNLYTEGQQCVQYLVRRYLCGIPVLLPRWSPGKKWIVGLYGIISMLWRVFVCLSLSLAVVAMAGSLGWVIAGIGLTLWWGVPILHGTRLLFMGDNGQRPSWPRLLFAGISAASIGLLLTVTVPWSGRCAAPAIVEYAPYTIVRARCAGVVVEVFVRNGQFVRAGDPLIRIENKELLNELADLQLQIRQSLVRGRQFEHEHKTAAFQAEQKRRESLELQFAEKKRRSDQLLVTAARDGHVIGHQIESLRGRHFSIGDEMLALGNESRKELRLAICQDDLGPFRAALDRPVHVRLPGEARWTARLKCIVPRAETRPVHPALLAPFGGALPAEPTSGESGDGADYVLVRPCFTGVVALDDETSSRLRAGQRAHVECRRQGITCGRHLWHLFESWVRTQLDGSA